MSDLENRIINKANQFIEEGTGIINNENRIIEREK